MARVLVGVSGRCCGRTGSGKRANTHGQSGRVVNPRPYECSLLREFRSATNWAST